MSSSESTRSHTVGTLKELSSFSRRGTQIVDGTIRDHDGADGSGNLGDECVVDSVDGAQRLFDLAGVDGGTADLEHVVGAAVVEHEAVVVEVAEVAGGIVAVGGEECPRVRAGICRA